MDKRLILVEDDPGYLALLTRLLERAGYDVLGLESGEEAMERFAESPVPLVVTDLVMLDVDGIALLKFIKEHSPETQVIAISGKGTIEQAVEAMREGAFDFLVKPIAEGRLESLVSSCFEARQGRENGEHLPSGAAKALSDFQKKRQAALETDLRRHGLTPSEVRIAALILKGGTDHEIADRLFISYHTVRKHIQNLFRKMKVNNRIDLIMRFK